MANEYLKQLGSPPGPADQGLKDYNHAARVFGTGATYGNNGIPGIDGGSYNRIPRTKFLFHVYFNLNRNIPAVANLISDDKSSVIGLMVKTAQLPSYELAVSEMNQYNRKRLVQTRINYNPAQIVFNDDASDLIRNMWYQYYQYYYSDPIYKYGNTPNQNGTLGQLSAVPSGFSYGANDTYSPSRVIQHWGLSGQGYNNPSLQSLSTALLTGPASGVEPFFNDITIYGMDQKSYAQYTMINPLITSWQHDTYDYSQGNGIVTHTMTIKYENVKYYSGAVGGEQPSEQVTGFARDGQYDTTKSPIAAQGGTNRSPINGQPQPSGNKQDLQANSQGGLTNVLGAVGQGLVPTASAFVGAALGQSGAYTQQILSGLAPALAGGSIDAARQAAGALGGFLFPTGPRIPTETNTSAETETPPASAPAVAEPEYNAYNDAAY